MSLSSRKQRRKKQSSIAVSMASDSQDQNEDSGYFYPIFFAVTCAVVGLSYAVFTSSSNLQKAFWGFFAFYLGAIFEIYRLSGKWKTTFWIVSMAFGGSLLAFIPGKKESNYSLDGHMTVWTVVFGLGLVFVSAIAFRKKVTKQLGEGATLLFTLAFDYWIYRHFERGNISTPWLIALLLPSLYVLRHAFTYTHLTDRARLRLSLWTSSLLLVFGFKYIIDVGQLDIIDDLLSAGDKLGAFYVFAECFFLGAAGSYIAQNILMIVSYLPTKKDTDYWGRIRKLSAEHVERFSAQQADIKQVFFILCLILILYISNIKFNFAEDSLIIWSTLMLFPLMLDILLRISRNKDSETSLSTKVQSQNE